ncbi:MAG: transglycosylase SLT domain-containing protein [Oceanospirillaceae bacterium]|nr:transglycosylase SLT domain-containing protein [Oceanospirillaceae bacterium]MCP5335337.1 transglycosylase SLT domain-containing protein [Oceanospirillaceae bacterium]MCP5350710.1 transglycosylase SLT domain-containing protein [Oceanospirillaceae bacterium]
MTRYVLLLISMAMLTVTSWAAAVQVVPRGFNSDEPSSEFNLSEAELNQVYTKAVSQYRDKLRAYWSDAEVSGQSRYVSYSPDLRQKWVIDFQSNEMQISLPTEYQNNHVDYVSLRSKMSLAVEGLLSLSIASAVEQDPVNQAVMQVAGIRYAQELGESGKDLILEELFSEKSPSQQVIRMLSDKLSKKAFIRYSSVASIGKIALSTVEKTTFIVPLPVERMQRKAERYKPYIYENAEKFALPADLIYAIIHAESYFNPLARSHIPAYGLMQIVPHTAGKDAAQFLTGKEKIFSPTYLYNPQKNIQLGSAYFHLLYYRYLKDISDPQTRLFCAIAAYNTGTQNVMRTLTGQSSINRAEGPINRMNNKDVLRKLLRQLPSIETREYLNKVLSLRRAYAQQ